jgi:ligand-binding SRPBCC domain-containing protein
MTALVQLVTDIAAPIDLVYDLARDLDLHARSMAHSGERAIAGRTTGRIDAGEMVTWRARHFGLWWTLTSRITTAERPTRFADEQVSGPFVWFRHEHRFVALPDGRTRMLDRWEHRSPLGPLGSVVDRLVLARYMRGQLEIRNRALRAEAEVMAAAG